MQQPESAPIDEAYEPWENSYQIDNNNTVSENTSLLDYSQSASLARRRCVNSSFVISILLLLLIGVCIGIYLLVLQFRSDDILPPIFDGLEKVSNRKWLPNTYKSLTLSPQRIKANRVVIIQTYTDQCYVEVSCIKLLLDMQEKSDGEKPMYYNFLVSSNGQLYEALGWRPSPLIKRDSSASIIVALIGNFTYTHPSNAQINGVSKFFDNSIKEKNLDPSFKIIFRDNVTSPNHLFEVLRTLPQMN